MFFHGVTALVNAGSWQHRAFHPSREAQLLAPVLVLENGAAAAPLVIHKINFRIMN